MPPEQVREGQDDAGSHPAGQAGSPDGLTLDVGKAALLAGSTGALDVTDDGQEETSLAEEVAGQILQQAPDVFRQTVDELTEQQETAMRNHRYYHDQAINGTEVSLGGSPAADAKDYLQLAITASAHKSQLMKGMFSLLGKAKRPNGSKGDSDASGDINISGDGAQIVVAMGGHRGMLEKLDKICGTADGKMTAADVMNAIPKTPAQRS